MSEEDRVAGIFYSSVLKTGSNKTYPRDPWKERQLCSELCLLGILVVS